MEIRAFLLILEDPSYVCATTMSVPRGGVCQDAWAIPPALIIITRRPRTLARRRDKVRRAQSKASQPRRNRDRRARKRTAEPLLFECRVTTSGNNFERDLRKVDAPVTPDRAAKMMMYHTDPEQNDYEPENALLWVSVGRKIASSTRRFFCEFFFSRTPRRVSINPVSLLKPGGFCFYLYSRTERTRWCCPEPKSRGTNRKPNRTYVTIPIR